MPCNGAVYRVWPLSSLFNFDWRKEEKSACRFRARLEKTEGGTAAEKSGPECSSIIDRQGHHQTSGSLSLDVPFKQFFSLKENLSAAAMFIDRWLCLNLKIIGIFSPPVRRKMSVNRVLLNCRNTSEARFAFLKTKLKFDGNFDVFYPFKRENIRLKIKKNTKNAEKMFK